MIWFPYLSVQILSSDLFKYLLSKLISLRCVIPFTVGLSWSRICVSKLDLHLQEYSLPPQEVQVEKTAEEKPDIATETEAVPPSNDEAPPAALEEKSETSVQDNADKSEAEETNTAAEETNTAVEETSEAAVEEEAEEKAEIKVWYYEKLMVI